MLEPVYIKKRHIILDEFDESMEAIFVMQGQVVIGYEINKSKKYCLKLSRAVIIGDYGMTFNQRS